MAQTPGRGEPLEDEDDLLGYTAGRDNQYSNLAGRGDFPAGHHDLLNPTAGREGRPGLDYHTAGREGQPGPTLVDLTTLAQVLSTLRTSDKFVAPSYDGASDVELFITQFMDVAVANRWTDGDATLHLRSRLTGTAQGCGLGTTVEEILAALRARFGMTMRQAKERLMNLRRTENQPLQELGAEVKRLVGLAFPTLSSHDQEGMCLDYFLRVFDNKALQRHMLAIKPGSLAEAIQSVDEYLTAGGTERASKPRVMPVENENEVVESSKCAQVDLNLTRLVEAVHAQSELLAKIVQSLCRDKEPVSSSTPPSRLSSVACYGCGGPHLVKQCPHRASRPVSGNDGGLPEN